MKHKTRWLLIAMTLMLLNVSAMAFRFSAGAYGGLNYPVAQQDAKSGSVFGLKLRVPLTSFLAFEPNYTHLKNGDGEVNVEDGWNTTMTHEGGKYSTFGVDLALGGVSGFKGFHSYGLFGISSAKFAKQGIPDLTKSAYWVGLGLEFAFTDMISLELRGKTLIFPYKDEVKDNGTGSRKNGIITAGLNVYFNTGGK